MAMLSVILTNRKTGSKVNEAFVKGVLRRGIQLSSDQDCHHHTVDGDDSLRVILLFSKDLH